MAEKWNGFDTEKFDLNGREAIVVFAAYENRIFRSIPECGN